MATTSSLPRAAYQAAAERIALGVKCGLYSDACGTEQHGDVVIGWAVRRQFGKAYVHVGFGNTDGNKCYGQIRINL